MLALDSPAWSNLKHAYGLAADIPTLLRAVAESPSHSDPTSGPWFGLWSALYHQGDVFPASFAAVPHLIEILARNADCACFDFFLLPASIELVRYRKGETVPTELSVDYYSAIQQFPSIAESAASRHWDSALATSALAAIAVAKSQFDTAELLIEIDSADTREVLKWYATR